jgi:hypothetical protein
VHERLKSLLQKIRFEEYIGVQHDRDFRVWHDAQSIIVPTAVAAIGGVRHDAHLGKCPPNKFRGSIGGGIVQVKNGNLHRLPKA